MSKEQDFLGFTESDSSLLLKAKVLILQLKGAGYAAVFCLVAVFVIWGLYGLGLLLPEESREAPDPTPFSHVVPDTADQQSWLV